MPYSRSPANPSSNGATATPSPDEAATREAAAAGRKPVDIQASGIVKEFGTAAALRGVDLTVRAGELMALLGPSGSGKTTLLRVIAGLEIPDQGQVLFGGEDATSLPVQRRGVGFVFQHYALFKHLNVFENVAYGLRARRRPPPEAALAERVLTLLDLVQLGGLDRRFPAQLSGGQRQRVALARALAVEPRVLLLDEPFGALDAKVRKDLRRWLRDIHDRTGQTTIFVTHDQDEALELADRVAILSGGLIEQVGTPDEVHDEPASAFVMSFVGETARVPVRVAAGQVWAGDRALDVAAGELRGAEADLYLRPWDLIPARDEPDLVGVVRLVRRVGAGRRAELDLAGGGTVQVELPVATPVRVGERLGLRIIGGRVFARAG